MRLFANIVPAIRRDGVAGLVLVGHGTRRFGPVRVQEVKRRMSREPLDMRRAGVGFASIAKLIFAQQLEAKLGEPYIMESRFAHPLGAGMIHVTGLVAALRRSYAERGRLRKRAVDHPVARVQELARFEQHLDHVLVAVPARALAGICMKKEDVHDGKKGRKEERRN
jgi:hypothetical protein